MRNILTKVLAKKMQMTQKKIWKVIKGATNDHDYKAEKKSIINSNNIKIDNKNRLQILENS